MTTLLKLEYLALFLFSIFLFSLLPYVWWWYPVLLFVPDVGMLGYIFSSRVGAWTYNLFHLLFVGVYAHSSLIQLAGVIMIAHASLDRILGFGLKHENSFKHTHLGSL